MMTMHAENTIRELDRCSADIRKVLEELRAAVINSRNHAVPDSAEDHLLTETEERLVSLSVLLRRADSVKAQMKELLREYDRAEAESYELIRNLMLDRNR